MEYQVKMVYDQKDVAALVRALEYRRHPERGVRLARRIGYPIFGVLIFLSGLGVLLAAFPDPSALCIGIASFLVGILLFRRASVRGMEKRSWKKYPNKGMTLTYTFYDDHFEEEDEVSGKNEFPYISIKNGNRDEGHYFLFTLSNAAHILKTDSFTQGDPEEFLKFLQKKSAVTLDPVER